jgi:chemotaxis signal transduction protein
VSPPLVELEARLAELRSAFDEAFAKPVVTASEVREDVLAVRLGSEQYALRAAEIAEIAADRELTQVPSESPELLGVVGTRAGLVAVFDLAALIGRGRGAAPRWTVVARGSASGFAFDGFDGQLRVTPDAFAAVEAPPHPALRRVLMWAGIARPVIDLTVLVERSKELARSGEARAADRRRKAE